MGLRTMLGLKKRPAPPPEPEKVAPAKRHQILFSDTIFDKDAVQPHIPAFPMPNTGVVEQGGAIPFRSESCSSHHFYYGCYEKWCAEIKENPRMHRKQWEFVYILQALWERGLLSDGKSGVGFGVGTEPLAALMARMGCTILATDLDVSDKFAAAWSETNQHSSELGDLNNRGICPPDIFAERTTFRPVDMNNIPTDVNGFDFCWSACCFEHLGSIENGLRFYKESIKTLKPGGLAIHTTELNLSSDGDTIDNRDTVLFRKSDIEGMMDELRAEGHTCEPLLIHSGSAPIDNFIDLPTYSEDSHLRLAIEQYVTTSIGIITRRKM